MSVIFISHALEEALLLADRITVLRDGRHVVTDDKANFDRERIVQAMVGARSPRRRSTGRRRRNARPQGECCSSVRNLRHGGDGQEQLARRCSRARSRAVFGLGGRGPHSRPSRWWPGLIKRDFFHGGEILLRGRPVRLSGGAPRCATASPTSPRTASSRAFFETMSIAQNIYMGLQGKLAGARGLGVWREGAFGGRTLEPAAQCRAIGKDVKVIELSGGNQQKVVIAKSLVQEPDIVIFDEPTRGVDVGAIAEIHAEINRPADAGKAVVVISSYLPEVMALSDRILVAKQGKVVTEFSATEATQEAIMYAAIH